MPSIAFLASSYLSILQTIRIKLTQNCSTFGSKAKAFSKLGCHSEVFELPSNTSENKLKEFIEDLNNDDKFHGILLQLPLPKHLNEKDILKKMFRY